MVMPNDGDDDAETQLGFYVWELKPKAGVR